jgi:hypothetical protein
VTAVRNGGSATVAIVKPELVRIRRITGSGAAGSSLLPAPAGRFLDRMYTGLRQAYLVTGGANA